MTPQQAADSLLAYIQRHVPERGVALLAGNSVHADRAFLRREPYKKVIDHLHYRILDVSSIKEAARRWWYVTSPAYLVLFKAFPYRGGGGVARGKRGCYPTPPRPAASRAVTARQRQSLTTC